MHLLEFQTATSDYSQGSFPYGPGRHSGQATSSGLNSWPLRIPSPRSSPITVRGTMEVIYAQDVCAFPDQDVPKVVA